MNHRVFITGGTGYIGCRLIPVLQEQGHKIIALVREQSKSKLPPSCTAVIGDALNGESYKSSLNNVDTFIQLVGVSHPSPAKAQQFVEIDLRSGLEAVRVAREAGIQHFVYVSVAQPAPVMKAYIEARGSCEQAIRDSGINSTILRPWYVLGPGHRWPYMLVPFYWLASQLPATRDGAHRLGLVTIQQMINALRAVVSAPARGVRILEVPQIRDLARTGGSSLIAG